MARHANSTGAPVPQAGILRIRAYQQGASKVAGIERPIKLSSNESSFGPCPAALAAYQAAAASLHRYPDGSQSQLREAIAETYGLNAANIVCGNGSDELIQMVIRGYAGPGDEVLMSENCFLMCRIHALAQGADVVVAPETDYRVDVDALLARVSPKTRVLTLANPNNPTGTYIDKATVQRLHAELPKNVVLLLDGAYAEYVTKDDYDAGADMVLQHDNIVMTRTFSKIYGLSSLRIGWAYMPDSMLDIVQRMRTPFNANGPAMAAAAAAVADRAFTEKVRQHTASAISAIRVRLSALGLAVLPSVTNFYLVLFPAGCGCTAAEADRHLRNAGIIPRPVDGKADSELRITVGTDDENAAVLTAFETLMQPRMQVSG